MTYPPLHSRSCCMRVHAAIQQLFPDFFPPLNLQHFRILANFLFSCSFRFWYSLSATYQGWVRHMTRYCRAFNNLKKIRESITCCNYQEFLFQVLVLLYLVFRQLIMVFLFITWFIAWTRLVALVIYSTLYSSIGNSINVISYCNIINQQ